MNLILQYVIVFLLVVAAGWSAWRMLRGRRVLGRGHTSDGCAGCSSAQELHRPAQRKEGDL